MNNRDVLRLLPRINSAQDVRALAREDLPELCTEVRSCIIDTISKTSGHFASGLGVVELTVALHYVYNTPQDILVWDVGHQAYPHKILTGHRRDLATIRQHHGLHAFIWRGESPYDWLSTGHASTSIGSALGLAVAERAKPVGKRRKVVAIIGDGALSGGCAFEALNHAGSLKDIDLTVILNDNEMSISENVGSLAQGLSHVISSPHYVKLVEGGKRILKSLPAVRDLAMRAQEHVKGMLMPGTLFEEFGFNYIGPIDGHDVGRLVTILQNIREMSGLTFLHVVTTKGKGYAPAEQDPVCYHGVPSFNPDEGICPKQNKEDLSFSATFGQWLCDKAATDPTLMGITPAMREGSGMAQFAKRFPKQFFDVAIAEQHAMVFASGLAAGGMRPVVNIYSTFMQRAYDGLIHDMAIQNLPIILCLDRGGLVGPDGPTHNGSFDIAYTRTVPNLVIMAPSTRCELYQMLNTAYELKCPVVIRYPRTNGESLRNAHLSLKEDVPFKAAACLNLAPWHEVALSARRPQAVASTASTDATADTTAANTYATTLSLLGLSEADLAAASNSVAAASAAPAAVATGSATTATGSGSSAATTVSAAVASLLPLGRHKKVAILGFGPLVHDLMSLAQTEEFTLINMRFIKPLNEDLVALVAKEYDLIVTVEEGSCLGGIGEGIAAVMAALPASQCRAQILNIGVGDNFVMEGTRAEVLAEQGLTSATIRAQIVAALEPQTVSTRSCWSGTGSSGTAASMPSQEVNEQLPAAAPGTVLAPTSAGTNMVARTNMAANTNMAARSHNTARPRKSKLAAAQDNDATNKAEATLALAGTA